MVRSAEPSRRRGVAVAWAVPLGAGLGLLTQVLALASAFLAAAGLFRSSGPAASVSFGAPFVAGAFSCASYGCLYGPTNHVTLDAAGATLNVLLVVFAIGLLGLTGLVRFPLVAASIGAVGAGLVFLATGMGPGVGQAAISSAVSMGVWIAAMAGAGAGAVGMWAFEARRRRAPVAA